MMNCGNRDLGFRASREADSIIGGNGLRRRFPFTLRRRFSAFRIRARIRSWSNVPSGGTGRNCLGQSGLDTEDYVNPNGPLRETVSFDTVVGGQP